MTRAHAGTSRSARRGFTLLELLVVITVVIILVGLVVVVASRTLGTQRERQAEALVTTLDRALEEYKIATGVFPTLAGDTNTATDTIVAAHGELFDPTQAWNLGSEVYARPGLDLSLEVNGGALGLHAASQRFPLTPTSWFFMEFARGVGDAEAVIADLPGQALRADLLNQGQLGSAGDPLALDPERFATRRQAIDPWGNPILFVQPGNIAAEGLFGRTQNQRPYFLSAGIDEKYGFGPEVFETVGEVADAQETELIGYTEDNVTSTPVGPVQRGGQFRDQARLRGAP